MPQSRVQQAHKRAFQSGDPRWMILQQAHEKHWQVRKGEKATAIFFTKPYEVDDDEAEDGRKTIRVLKHYPLFHASQVDGIPAYKASRVEEASWTRPAATDLILKNSGAVGGTSRNSKAADLSREI